MSLIHEIHGQRPMVRNVMFLCALVIVVSVIGFTLFSSVEKDVFFATHPDAQERQTFLASRDAGRPGPLAIISRAAGSLTASIGSLIGWNKEAGFDRGGRQDTIQGDPHPLPLAQ